MGTPSSNTERGGRGAPASKTEAGPPENIMARGAKAIKKRSETF